LNLREQDPLGVSRSKPRSIPVPSFEAGGNESSPIVKTTAAFKNPYASSRKHAMEATPSIEPTLRRDGAQEDLASVVLGRPSQRLKPPEPNASDGDTISSEPPDASARKYRARNFRNSLQFGCTLEVLNYDTLDNDGDVAAGAVSKASTDTRVDDAVHEDDDVLNFVAFPSSSSKTPE
jgi:hypothetical protein